MLTLGLLVQFLPFPFLGWAVTPSEGQLEARVLFAQVFPAWAAFAVLLRLEPQLRAIGVFPVFGWVAIGSAVLSVFTGLLQKDWRLGVGVWASVGFALSVGALSFSGQPAGLALLIGTGLAATALMLFGRALQLPGGTLATHRKRAIWAKVGLVISAAAASGMIGFISCTGGLQWLSSGLAADLTEGALFALVFFLSALLVWRQAWAAVKSFKSTGAGWLSVLMPFLIIILSLGIIWTGSLAGGALQGGVDQVASGSALDFFFKKKVLDLPGETFGPASWLYWGAFVLALVTAYWTSAGKQDSWLRLHHGMPRTSAFIGGGYGIDTVTSKALNGVIWMGRGIRQVVDARIWGDWLPTGFTSAIRWTARNVNRSDSWLSSHLALVVRKSADGPAKLLQLIQSGDVQWYLFFAVGCGIAMLLHFLRF